jgi:type I restriction enzyme S subunit
MSLPGNESCIRNANNWISDDDLPKLKAKPFPAGTTVFAKIGEALKANRLRFLVRPTLVDNNMMGAIPVTKGLDPKFFFYALSQFDFGEIAGGTALPYLTVSTLSQLNISLPPLSEQRAIAHILGTLDDKIELNRRMSETLEAMARALFKSWFVDFDPVRAKAEGRDPGLPQPLADLFPARLVDSELGEIPEGWEVKSLDEIARFLNGLALQKYPPVGDRSLPVIKIAQLRSGNTTGVDRATADLDEDYIVNDGDILFSWSGSLECVLWAGGKGALNQHLFKVTSATYPRWLCYLGVHLHLERFRHIAAGKATTMGHIQRHHLSDAQLVVPPIQLLRAITERIEPIIESLWKRAVESRTLAALRDALLPKLISGELRVKDAEKFIESATA